MLSAIYISIPLWLMVLAETWWGRRRGTPTHRFTDSITNFTLWALGHLVAPFAATVALGYYVLVYEHFALIEQPDSWWMLVPCLFFYDFLYYWAHRWGHTMNLWWSAHVVHHSSEQYNLSISFRQPWFQRLLIFPVFTPMSLLGFAPEVGLVVALIGSLHQFWIHTKFVGRLPRVIEFVFNCPSHHRVHHAVNPQYIDKNYGGMFILWDRMLGTYADEEESPRYGIVRPLGSSNPLWANTHVFVDLWTNMRATPGWLATLGLLFRPPSELSKGSLEHPRVARPSPPHETSTRLQAYIGVVCLSIAGGMVASVGATSLGIGPRLLLGGLTLWAGTNVGGLLDGKAWARKTEATRWLVTLTVLVGIGVLPGLDLSPPVIALVAAGGLALTAALVGRAYGGSPRPDEPTRQRSASVSPMRE